MRMPRWLHYTLILGFTAWMLQGLWQTRGQFGVMTAVCAAFVAWNLYTLYVDLKPRYLRWRGHRRTDRILENFKRRNPDFKPSKPS